MKHGRVIIAMAMALCLSLSAQALAVGVDADMLEDPALEARARAVMKSLRCLVCQNQSIEESNAGLARDLRRIVRERVVAGDSDRQILAFVVDRYGDWVLLKPPFKAMTVVLWLGPLLLFILGGCGVFVFYRGRGAKVEAEPLSDDERARLASLLDDGDD